MVSSPLFLRAKNPDAMHVRYKLSEANLADTEIARDGCAWREIVNFKCQGREFIFKKSFLPEREDACKEAQYFL